MLEFSIESRPLRAPPPPAERSPRRRPSRKELYAEGGVEPRLEDLLADPLTEAVMRRDGVSVDSLRQLISITRKGLRDRFLDV